MAAPPTDAFAFRTRLVPGRELDYERFHRAIPTDLDRAMRAAGVLGWRIYRNETVLTHIVEALDRARMQSLLSRDPINLLWQEQVSPFIDAESGSTLDDQPSAAPGALIWDMSWPTR
jgi:L-rhamnose mutarotase